MDLVSILFPSSESFDDIPAATMGWTALAVTVAAAWSSILVDLLYAPDLSAGVLPFGFLLRFLAALASTALWTAWLLFAFSVLRQPVASPLRLAAGLLVAQAPAAFAAGLLTPFALLLPHQVWVRDTVRYALGLWTLALQTSVIRRISGWSTAAAWLFLLANLLLPAALLGTVSLGTFVDLIVRAVPTP